MPAGGADPVSPRAAPAPGSGWIASDRNGDGRYGPGEFEAIGPGGARTGSGWTAAALRGGYSARRLIGAPARDLYGYPMGRVRDILIGPQGHASLLIAGQSVPWRDALIAAGAQHVEVPPEGAGAGSSAPTPATTPEWRASRFLGGRAQIRRGLYAGVRDLILSPGGEVVAVVVDRGPHGESGRYVYPWRGPNRLAALQPFDYGALDIAAPR